VNAMDDRLILCLVAFGIIVLSALLYVLCDRHLR
jgi:hypothetical protein